MINEKHSMHTNEAALTRIPSPATSRAAVMLDMDGKIGVVAPGAFADIVAVGGDPLHDIKALENVQFVMKDGKVFKNENSARP